MFQLFSVRSSCGKLRRRAASLNLVPKSSSISIMMAPSQDMRDKFRGCLVGALIGDCLGSPFEGLSMGCLPRSEIEKVVGTNSVKLRKAAVGSFEFTDDSAMARSICKSLLKHKHFDGSDMAARFLEDFLQNSNRGYGSGMITIFDKWKANGTQTDPFLPAREQFSGSGSYGNGAAMRVAPVALFEKEENNTIELAKETALLTHSNKHGYNGAILQAIAVHRALRTTAEIKKKAFVASLKETMQKLECADSGSSTKKPEKSETNSPPANTRFSRQDSFSFSKQLEMIESLVGDEKKSNDPEALVKLLGNDISAQEAVPAAIYSFIHCSDLNFIEALIFSYTLGGDTDTIGTMTGALAGAHFGFSSIPEEWKNVCEGLDDAISFADQFYNLMSA